MIDYYKFAIPAIVVLIIGGMVSGLMAYNLYPEKHVNVNIVGKCYELLDSANVKYQNLAAENEIEILKLQLNAINSDKEQAVRLLLPVIFSGTQAGISDFTYKYNINIISDKSISDNSNVDKRIVKATISKSEFQRIVNDLTLEDVNSSSKTVAGSIGLQPNTYITPEEGKQISLNSNEFMREGIHEIIGSKDDGVKPAECRTKIQY
jgi:hypothetical protein